MIQSKIINVTMFLIQMRTDENKFWQIRNKWKWVRTGKKRF